MVMMLQNFWQLQRAVYAKSCDIVVYKDTTQRWNSWTLVSHISDGRSRNVPKLDMVKVFQTDTKSITSLLKTLQYIFVRKYKTNIKQLVSTTDVSILK